MQQYLIGFARPVRGEDPVERFFHNYINHWDDLTMRKACQQQVIDRIDDIPDSRIDQLVAEVNELEKKQLVLLNMSCPNETIRRKASEEMNHSVVRYICLRDILRAYVPPEV